MQIIKQIKRLLRNLPTSPERMERYREGARNYFFYQEPMSKSLIFLRISTWISMLHLENLRRNVYNKSGFRRRFVE